jgi:biotin transporter BioY
MTLRLKSRLAATLSSVLRPKIRLFGAPRRRHQNDASAAATTGGGLAPSYAIGAPMLQILLGWSVHNCASNRVVAAGLTQDRAATLCALLNLPGEHARKAQAGGLRRRG